MDGADIRIPLAECREIYDVGDVDRAMESGSGARNEALTAFYGKMKTLGGVRYVVKPSSFDGLDPLYARCPNFTPVLDDLKRYLALAVAGNEPMNFTPILLLGEPGIGKTHFARQLANVLGTGFEFVSMSSLTAGWILSGASSQWSHAKPGKVAQALVCGDYANPLVVLDEVDKAGGGARYDPMGALYGLLEQDTARQFKDEFVEVDIDASHIMWVSTANDERSIPEPILSRMNVYTVPRPDHDQACIIARTLYEELVAAHDWGFAPEAPEDVIDRLAGVPPRDMRKVLLAAFGNAKLAHRDHLLPADLEAGRATRQKKIGF
jgi:ATP-dependent Lon protease